MNPIETYEHKDWKIKIFIDECPPSPRTETSVGRIVSWGGDDIISDNDHHTHCGKFEQDYIKFNDHESSAEAFKEWYDRQRKDQVHLLPLYICNHTHISLSIHGADYPYYLGKLTDSAQCGYFYATPATYSEGCGTIKRFTEKTRQHCARLMADELDRLNRWYEGSIVGYTTERKYASGETDGRNWQLNVSGDSVWGFYSVEEAVDDAKRSIGNGGLPWVPPAQIPALLRQQQGAQA